MGVVFAVLNGIRLSQGEAIYNALKKQVDDQDAEYGKIRMDEINRCKEAIAEEENVGLQLEMEYRTRLNEAYKQVKKRLDYQLATANVLRAAEQKHMVQWIIDNVRKSITAKQETDALKACVADLKALAK